MKIKIILFLIFGIDACILFFEATQLSISSSEAYILYGNFSFLQIVTKFFLHIFTNHDIGLRFFMICLHLISAFLLYLITKRYILQERNRLWIVIIFLLLPGAISSALVVSHASILIFGLFLYVYLIDKSSDQNMNFLLIIYLFIDAGFSYLFLSLVFYNIYMKKEKEAFFIFILYCISILFYGFVAHGVPSGHLLDILGVYSAIFSPIIFLYIFYTLYRKFLLKQLDQIWFIASTAFIISIILSFRQRINLEYFAPYLMLVIPLSAQMFIQSYRIRLKKFRKTYKIIFILAFVFLFINAFVVFFHKELYLILKNPKNNFAYNLDIAVALSEELKTMKIECLHVKKNKEMQLRLRFYGFPECHKNILEEVNLSTKQKTNVTISYKNKILYKANVTKLNSK